MISKSKLLVILLVLILMTIGVVILLNITNQNAESNSEIVSYSSNNIASAPISYSITSYTTDFDLSNEIIFEDMHTGVALKDWESYTYDRTAPCKDLRTVGPEVVIRGYGGELYPKYGISQSDFITFAQNSIAFSFALVNKNIAGEKLFDEYKSKLIEYNPSEHTGNASDVWHLYCSGATYAPIDKFDIKIPGLDYLYGYAFLGGTQEAWGDIGKMTITLFGYNDSNIIQFDFEIYMHRFVNTGYGQSCKVTKGEYYDSVDLKCLANKVKEDPAYMGKIKSETIKLIDQLGLQFK